MVNFNNEANQRNLKESEENLNGINDINDKTNIDNKTNINIANDKEDINDANNHNLQNNQNDKNSQKTTGKNLTLVPNHNIEDSIKEYGQGIISSNEKEYNIYLLSIIGEIEGHECLPQTSKTTKYEHVLPELAIIQDDKKVDGVLLLLNTMGGDVESGLAIAEMVSSLSKPTVSLVLGGSHSIGIPLAVSADYSMIVPSGTMVIHPVRLSGTVIGAPATYEYFRQMENRILGFISNHCNSRIERLREMMMNTEMMTKDLGTVLVGKEAVDEGIIDSIGGIADAFQKLYSMIDETRM